MSKQPTKNSALPKGKRKGSRPPKEGSFFEIDLGNDLYGYGRMLQYPLCAFYKTSGAKVHSIEDIGKHPVLFKIWVMKYAWKNPKWKVIGTAPLQNEFLKPTWFAKRDAISGELSMYSSWNGVVTEKKATRKQIIKLETAAVWDPDHIEDRLRDHYQGRENKWAKDNWR
jgi:hypothetical protein